MSRKEALRRKHAMDEPWFLSGLYDSFLLLPE
jgi:hypothetical protein